jgi:hypothetical protein
MGLLSWQKQTLILKILLVSSFSWASPQKNLELQFRYAGESLVVKTMEVDFHKALPVAAQKCFEFFRAKTKSQGLANESTGLEIIDICANPLTL